MKPLISVCIPAFNAEKFIGDCIDSVLAQTLSDFEIVIVDDNSSDQTVRVVSAYSDRRIRLIKNDSNIGMEANWNKSVSLANGCYIKLLCDDDIIYSNCLELQVGILDKPENSDVSMVSGLRDIIGSSGRVLIKSRGVKKLYGRISYEDFVRLIFALGTNPIGEPTAIMFRKKHFLKSRRFSAIIPYVIDLDFWLEMFKFGTLYVLPITIAGFRISVSSTSVRMVAQQKEDFLSLLKKLYDAHASIVTEWDYKMSRQKCLFNALMRSAIYRFDGLKDRYYKAKP